MFECCFNFQALAIGLVDQAVESREEAIKEATRVLTNLM